MTNKKPDQDCESCGDLYPAGDLTLERGECPDCAIPCPECNGDGQLEVTTSAPDQIWAETVIIPCPECRNGDLS